MNNKKEIWLPIRKYERLYEISNQGRIRSLKRKNILRKTHKDEFGYFKVVLCKNNIKKTHRLHRLVAIAFHLNPKKKPQVNHKDSCKSNNNDWNLEWNTAKENMKHSYMIGSHKSGKGKRGEDNISAKLTEKQVIEIRSKFANNNYTYKELSKEYNISIGTIGKILQRILWKHI